ncbi:DUF2577 domain-containing protein [Paenibacillus psychroresistens]|uniref:DUF2577 domain-containing protein n=1 Tax=Paenibacillus psychroresistens TaxID=1778678 RepID=A0A6B8RDF4_9BACL|nr:DUF2577 domain-containing protein [Paenibacillus psychroresistens]QGQ93957.1 DUF2577 domain-containing protein [Paenibacillus psychroresistens]
MKLLNLIKQASIGAVEAGNPMNVQFGMVSSMNPLEVNLDQRFTLEEDFLIVPDTLTELIITIGSTEYTIRRGLELGDKVILLRVQGGQQFIILDRVVGV